MNWLFLEHPQQCLGDLDHFQDDDQREQDDQPNPCHSGQGKIPDEFSSRVAFISHFYFPQMAQGEVQALRV